MDNSEKLGCLVWIIALGLIAVFLYLIYPFIFTHKFSLLPFGHKEYSCEMKYDQFFPDDEVKSQVGLTTDPRGTKFPEVSFPDKFDLKMNYFGNRRSDIKENNWGVETSVPLTYCSNYCMFDASYKQCGPRDFEEKNVYSYGRCDLYNGRSDWYNISLPICAADGTRLFEESLDDKGEKYNIYPEYFTNAYFGKYSDIEGWGLKIYYFQINTLQYWNAGIADAEYDCIEKENS